MEAEADLLSNYDKGFKKSKSTTKVAPKLLSSSSLKDILKTTNKEAGRQKTIKKRANEEMIRTIIKEETGRAVRVKKIKRKPEIKKTSLIDPVTALNRQKYELLSTNNVYVYSRMWGAPGDDINLLESKYSIIKHQWSYILSRLRYGYESIIQRNDGLLSLSDTITLFSFVELPLDSDTIERFSRFCKIDQFDNLVEGEEDLLDFNKWIKFVGNFLRLKFLTDTLASSRKGMDSYQHHQQESTTASTLKASDFRDLFADGSLEVEKVNTMKYASFTNSVASISHTFSLINNGPTDMLRSKSQPEDGNNASATGLPPLKLRKLEKYVKMDKLKKAGGFDRSFGRQTPRCLQNNSVSALLGIQDAKTVTIGASNIKTVEELRHELRISQGSISYLDSIVEENIAWVHQNCDTSFKKGLSRRAISQCQKMSVERLYYCFEQHFELAKEKAFRKWKIAVNLMSMSEVSKLYSRAKSIAIMTNLFGFAICRQLAKVFYPWYLRCQWEKRWEQEAAAIQIQRIIRGFIHRRYIKRKRQMMACVIIQSRIRVYIAIRKTRTLKFLKKIHDNANIIKTWLKARLAIFHAKCELHIRKEIRAARNIQRVFRGTLGRERVKTLRELRKVQTKAAIQIQKIGRAKILAPNRVQARKKYLEQLKFEEAERLRKIEEFSAIKLQSLGRMLFGKKFVSQLKSETAQNHSARIITRFLQRLTQTKESRQKLAELRQERRIKEDQDKGATGIQSLFRMKKAKKEVEKLKRNKLNEMRRRGSVVKLQSQLRGHLARKKKDELLDLKKKKKVHVLNNSKDSSSKKQATSGRARPPPKRISSSDSVQSPSSTAKNPIELKRSASSLDEKSLNGRQPLDRTPIDVKSPKDKDNVDAFEEPIRNDEYDFEYEEKEPFDKEEIFEPDSGYNDNESDENFTAEKSTTNDLDHVVDDGNTTSEKRLSGSNKSDKLIKSSSDKRPSSTSNSHRPNSTKSEPIDDQLQNHPLDTETDDRISGLQHDELDREVIELDAEKGNEVENEETLAPPQSGNKTPGFLDNLRTSLGFQPINPTLSPSRPNSSSSPKSLKKSKSVVSKIFDSFTGKSPVDGSDDEIIEMDSSRGKSRPGSVRSMKAKSSNNLSALIDSRPLSAKIETLKRGLSSMFLGNENNDQEKDTKEDEDQATELPPPKGSSSASAKKRRESLDQVTAAIIIQNGIRSTLARKRVQNRRREIIILQEKAGMFVVWASVTIQRCGRGKIGRRRWQQLYDQKKQEEEKYYQLLEEQQRIMAEQDRLRAEKDEEVAKQKWLSYQKKNKDNKAHQPAKNESANGTNSKSQPPSRPTTSPKPEDNEISSPSLLIANNELAEKLRQIDEMTQRLREKEEQVMKAAELANAKALEMELAIKRMEERAEKEERDRLARNAMLDMAAGPVATHRSQYASTGPRTMASVKSSARTPRTARGNPAIENLYAMHGPPTARTARNGTPRPTEVLTTVVNGQEWVQLWDPQVNAWYWYCELTGQAQWEEPSAGDYGSGYDETGAFTDYSTDNTSGYNTENDYGNTSAAGWSEYWDEQAQAKYWYNHETGEATWTIPPELENNTFVGTVDLPNSDEWVSYIDDATGQEYWYNTLTGETSWAR